MHKLKPLTPLGSHTPRVDRIGQFEIAETVETAFASVAARNGQEAAVISAMAQNHGLDLPVAGKAAQAGELAAFWISPSQWMCAAPHETHELLAQQLKATLGDRASVVEQTDAWCRFDVAGAKLCDLFERLTKADVRAMPPGSACRSTVEHLGVFLWRTAEDQMVVLGPRSSAASLHHALVTAARSIA